MRVMILIFPLLLGGCLVKTAANIVTLPARATIDVAKAVAPNQAKADQKHGREARKAAKKADQERKRQAAGAL